MVHGLDISRPGQRSQLPQRIQPAAIQVKRVDLQWKNRALPWIQSAAKTVLDVHTLPVLANRDARWEVLLPGAAHPSMQWAPGGGESAWAGMQLALSCMQIFDT